MFEAVEERKAGMPWGILGGLAAFGALLAVGYLIIN
jgi:hypothetical protein